MLGSVLLALAALGELGPTRAPPSPEGLGPGPASGLAGLRGDEQPDPPRWPDLLAVRVPVAARFHGWIAEGGRPEALPSASRAELFRLDAALAARDLPRPFAPFLALGTGGAGSRAESFAGVARASLAEATACARAREAELDADPGRLDPRLALARERGLDPTLIGLVRTAAESLEGRRALSAWLRPGIDALATAIYATARAAEEDPRLGDRLEVELGRQARQIGIFFYSELPWLPPETLAPGATPAAAALRARIVQARRITAARAGLPAERDLVAWEEALWRAALVGPGEPGSPARERSDAALFHLLRLYPPDSQPRRALSLLDELGSRLFAAPLPIRTRPCLALARAMLDRGPLRAVPGPIRAAVLATLAEARATSGEAGVEAAELADRLASEAGA